MINGIQEYTTTEREEELSLAYPFSPQTWRPVLSTSAGDSDSIRGWRTISSSARSIGSHDGSWGIRKEEKRGLVTMKKVVRSKAWDRSISLSWGAIFICAIIYSIVG